MTTRPLTADDIVRQNELIRRAQVAVFIVGNPDTLDFELFDVFDQSEDPRIATLYSRGMATLGVIGIIDGVPQSALELPLEKPAVDALAKAFLSHLAKMLHTAPTPNSEAAVRWLAALHSLTDPRTHN